MQYSAIREHKTYTCFFVFFAEFDDLIVQGLIREIKKMVTIPECEGLFEPLRVLEDNMAAADDQVDAYLRMTE